jgi:uncharacterized protein
MQSPRHLRRVQHPRRAHRRFPSDGTPRSACHFAVAQSKWPVRGVNGTEEQNLAIVQSLYAAFARGDAQTILAAVTNDVEWILPGPPDVIPFAGVHRGPQAVLQYFVVLNETLEFEKLEAQEFLARRDKVMVFGRSRDRMKSTGRSAENEWVAAVTLRGGKVARYQVYRTPPRWLRLCADGSQFLRIGLDHRASLD